MPAPTRTAERYARAVAAALAAVACLLLAANAGPTSTAGSPVPAGETAPKAADVASVDR
ncbi:hypothetical protein DMH12_34790 [Streptomyces sp. WAC 04229]|uniref:hypothetical protein n=1 Tax=Streptomyces sp. WAC 04229 TaxID=2203206 RepID=UPI000F73D869|nr:hypothetical protein [Streptomyces sp. WAC 04229]RSN41592.1 hypothetical protein DMH12_34790 [Streptomyces sp. WAC 04229]